MKKIHLFGLLLAFGGAALAEPSSKLAWTPENLALVKDGDAAKGKQLAEKNCVACHAPGPQAQAGGYPYLQGQVASYLYKQLHDYKDGSRDNALMKGMVAGLSERDMADVAAYYSAEAPPAGEKAEVAESALELVKAGDPRRILPPCEVCHEPGGQGQRIDVPALSGQNSAYTQQTLLDYRSGARHNDLYGRMRTLSQQLSDEEIEQLARYYSGLRR